MSPGTGLLKELVPGCNEQVVAFLEKVWLPRKKKLIVLNSMYSEVVGIPEFTF